MSRRLLVRYLKEKVDRSSLALSAKLAAGISYETQLLDERIQVKNDDDDSKRCHLSGSARYSLQKPAATGCLKSSTIIEPVEGQTGLWHLRTSFEPFHAELMAQILGTSCGRSLDYTSFGRIQIRGATINTLLRVRGPSQQRPEIVAIWIGRAIVAPEFQLESSASFGRLAERIPLETVKSHAETLLDSIFTHEFQPIMEGEYLQQSS